MYLACLVGHPALEPNRAHSGRATRFLTGVPVVSHRNITHSQEQPPYSYEMDMPCEDAVNAKIFVIDDQTHSTMLLAEEY